MMIQLAEGLAHCHTRGLVHQDLKPENIFVRDLRSSFSLPPTDLWLRPLVADFGSVNLASEAGEYTGSRPYMAPEQWHQDELGEWTSVFVLGIMLHEIMSRGVHPMGERSNDWHRKINPGFNRWQQNKRWRSWVNAGCPILHPLPDTDLARLVETCLAIAPGQRPSLRDFQTKLFDLLNHRSAEAARQVGLFLQTAQSQSAAEEWLYLQRNIEGLERAIGEHYPSTVT